MLYLCRPNDNAALATGLTLPASQYYYINFPTFTLCPIISGLMAAITGSQIPVVRNGGWPLSYPCHPPYPHSHPCYVGAWCPGWPSVLQVGQSRGGQGRAGQSRAGQRRGGRPAHHASAVQGPQMGLCWGGGCPLGAPAPAGLPPLQPQGPTVPRLGHLQHSQRQALPGSRPAQEAWCTLPAAAQVPVWGLGV